MQNKLNELSDAIVDLQLTDLLKGEVSIMTLLFVNSCRNMAGWPSTREVYSWFDQLAEPAKRFLQERPPDHPRYQAAKKVVEWLGETSRPCNEPHDRLSMWLMYRDSLYGYEWSWRLSELQRASEVLAHLPYPNMRRTDVRKAYRKACNLASGELFKLGHEWRQKWLREFEVRLRAQFPNIPTEINPEKG